MIITEYEIVSVSGYIEDARKLEELQRKHALYCSVNFSECLKMVDAVVFAENTMGREYFGYKERVQQALKSNLKILMSSSLAEKIEVNKNDKNIHIQQENGFKEVTSKHLLKEIQIPIISVIGLGENCDKFRIQVKIKTIIEDMGYNVLSICSNPLGKFLDMEILPGFLFSEDLSLPIKIEGFNAWIDNLQKQRNADIIILGCPGGVLQFDDYDSNHYGEIPLVVLNAVMSDYGILSLYRNSTQNKETINKLHNFCKMKYNTVVEDFVMSEQYYKVDYEARKIKYYKNSERKIQEFKVDGGDMYHISAVEDEKGVEGQVTRILSELENNFFSI